MRRAEAHVALPGTCFSQHDSSCHAQFSKGVRNKKLIQGDVPAWKRSGCSVALLEFAFFVKLWRAIKPLSLLVLLSIKDPSWATSRIPWEPRPASGCALASCSRLARVFGRPQIFSSTGPQIFSSTGLQLRSSPHEILGLGARLQSGVLFESNQQRSGLRQRTQPQHNEARSKRDTSLTPPHVTGHLDLPDMSMLRTVT